MEKGHVVVQRPTDVWAKIVGEPVLIDNFYGPDDCPKCGGQKFRVMEVRVENEYLIAGKGTGMYLECDKCDWVSQMMARTD